MHRLYTHILQHQLAHDEIMTFLAGPRQSGKTTCSQMVGEHFERSIYMNWDSQSHRSLIIEGQEAVATHAGLDILQNEKPCIILDELHKYKHWKQFLKGFYDLYKTKCHLLVTGSSRLDIFRHGGDSLMGRYFLYRMHPLSVAECLHTTPSTQLLRSPQQIDSEQYHALYEFGGFPKPFLTQSSQFSNRWQRLRLQQLVKEDIRDGTRIRDLALLECLVELLQHQSGHGITYKNLANKIGVAINTITQWIEVLSAFYYCFTIKPWHNNVSRSLLKEPKLYLWDWSLVKNDGARFENFIASHLLKAVHFWTDMGHGEFDLFYIRTLDQYEVDFVVTKDRKPWILIEAKQSHKQPINPHLKKYQHTLNAPHALQVCHQMPYVDADCFAENQPIKVPAATFLSQLI